MWINKESCSIFVQAVEEDLKYRIGITLIEDIGAINAKNLIAYCGGAEAVFSEKKAALLKIPGIGKHLANQITSQKILSRAEEEIAFIETHGIRALYYLDKDYPHRLKHCEDGPVMLYFQGDMDLNASRIVSVVGTRNATRYGKKLCEELIEGLKPHNPFVVSGLAYGIDICAHKAALKNNIPTAAVLGHGLDRIYPQIHADTAKQMVENGGLITEFLSGTNPDRENFPKRNRIVAGLSDAVIVVETKRRGGSMITANLAVSYNRDVFAVPGRKGDVFSEGCNLLIKANKAALIESVRDLEYIMRWEVKEKKKNVQKQLFVALSEEEEKLVSILKDNGKTSIDKISIQSQYNASKVAALLLNLEFSGVVRSLPGKIYELS